ncbi:hypothetical protein [Arenibaculum pallidiluteum]|uniref:hypothetical protein n=1 Tax=Arenibaculum pallidiluteum TaxID=2812559 RepID=UPI001A964BBB|nr:hypothetical protein [Arenibaculum pallidiluteum]
MSQDEEKSAGRAEPQINWAWQPTPPSEVRRIDPAALAPEELARLNAGRRPGSRASARFG